jgi:L-asparagine oxygenase
MTKFSFSDDERRRLEDIFRAAPNPHAYPTEAQLFAHRHLLAASPDWLVEQLHRMKSDATTPGWLYIKNGPLGFVPNTPLDGNGRNSHRDFIAHTFLMGVMQEFGHILTNRAEKRGSIPADITPVPGMGASKSNAGFAEPLGMHTENVHLSGERRPNYVGLYTLRGDPSGQAETLVANASRIVASLDPETIRELREPNFVIKMSESFKNGPTHSDPMPVISGPEDLPCITTEFNATGCLSDRADAAFKKLLEAATKEAVVVRLETGDLLITCNRRTIHGRGRFVPDFSNSQRRWLLRVCTVADLFELRDLVAPGAHRAFDLSTTHLRDMIVHCSGVLGLPQITPSSVPLPDIRATIKAYDAWINDFGVPSSVPDLPGVELVLFVANAIVRGDLLKEFTSDERLRFALMLFQHEALEMGLRGRDINIDMNILAAALAGNATFSELMQICLGHRVESRVPTITDSSSEGEKICPTI